jgi:FtsZ-interacting cell division protein ZipA
MNKKTLIIIAVSIAVIALVLFLFWDKIKEYFNKNKETEVMPPSTDNTNYGGGNSGPIVVNNSGGSGSITKAIQVGDVIKAAQPTKVYQANYDGSPSSTKVLATLTKGQSAGVVKDDSRPLVYQVYFKNVLAHVAKTAVVKA